MQSICARPTISPGNPTPTNCVFPLDTTTALPHNPAQIFARHSRQRFSRDLSGGNVQYLPGWTVQCINTECSARGQWLRMDHLRSELCTNCGAPLHRVPPPLGPRLRLRPRSLGHYRPGPR